MRELAVAVPPPARAVVVLLLLAVAACGGPPGGDGDSGTYRAPLGAFSDGPALSSLTVPDLGPVSVPDLTGAAGSAVVTDDPEVQFLVSDFYVRLWSVTASRPDPARLTSVVSASCPCFNARRATVQALVDQGQRYDGPAPRVVRVAVLSGLGTGGGLEVAVETEREAVRLIGPEGDVLQELPASRSSAALSLQRDPSDLLVLLDARELPAFPGDGTSGEAPVEEAPEEGTPEAPSDQPGTDTNG
ncbi:MAG: hypothetical protein ACT4PW_05460 [Acidimicrobiia bacterium]